MSLTLYNSIGWAVEKQTIAAGGGLTGPVLVSVTSTDPNTVRLVFDRKLMLEYRQAGSVYHAATLDLASFAIAKVSGGALLEVVRTIWINDTTIDLATANQQVFSYRVTCVAGGVMDFQGNVITLQTADFTGQQRTTYTTPSDIRMFTSGYPGMQEDLAGDEFYPDLAPPYLQNQNPAPAAINVSRYTNILFDVLDDYTGVDLTTVRVWAGGSLAYRGDTDTFLAPYAGPASSRSVVAKGYHFVLDPTVTFGEYIIILVEVNAYDLAGIPNFLSTSYSFKTIDETAPYINPSTQSPAAGSVDRPLNTNITLDVLDDGAGVDASTVWLKVSGVYAWLSDVQQPGFTVTKTTISGGYRYVINPDTDFASYETVTIAVYASDLSTPTNTLDTSYTFRTVDDIAPYISYRHPTEGDTNVTVWHEVNVNLVDAGSGVDANSVVITVGSVIAWQNDAAQPGFEGSAKTTIGGGFSYVIQHTIPFFVGSPVIIDIVCADVSGNILNTSYTFYTEAGSTPIIFDVVPVADQVNVPATTTQVFKITDANLDLNPAAVLCIINEVTAYQNQTQQNGFTVVRTPILGGYSYVVTPPVQYTWGSTVSVFIFAQDFSLATDTESFTFDVELSPDCFTGPLNAFEEKVVVPFTGDYKNLELIRYNLIQNFVKINPVTATRAVFLLGHTHELSVILRDLVPIPTEEERSSLLCKRRSLLTVAGMMPDKYTWLGNSTEELVALRVPLEHRQLIQTYLDAADETQVVLVMCFMVLLAKALV